MVFENFEGGRGSTLTSTLIGCKAREEGVVVK